MRWPKLALLIVIALIFTLALAVACGDDDDDDDDDVSDDDASDDDDAAADDDATDDDNDDNTPTGDDDDDDDDDDDNDNDDDDTTPLPGHVTLPFVDNFDSDETLGELPSNWWIYTSNGASIEISDAPVWTTPYAVLLRNNEADEVSGANMKVYIDDLPTLLEVQVKVYSSSVSNGEFGIVLADATNTPYYELRVTQWGTFETHWRSHDLSDDEILGDWPGEDEWVNLRITVSCASHTATVKINDTTYTDLPFDKLSVVGQLVFWTSPRPFTEFAVDNVSLN